MDSSMHASTADYDKRTIMDSSMHASTADYASLYESSFKDFASSSFMKDLSDKKSYR
jgi:hypothetical protein